MQQLQLAANGPLFSRMVMGYWRLMEWGFNAQQTATFIQQHLDLGITTTDHADIYGSYQCEQAFGDALRLQPSLRQHIQIVSKCGIALTARPEYALNHYITDASHIIASAERSLRNLHTDYLDLLLIHRPDPLMDADEVAQAFTTLRKSGKVRHVGVSNFTAQQFSLLQSRLDFPLVTNQVEISPLYQDLLLDGTLDLCQEKRIRPMAWSCLGGGRLFTDPAYQTLRDELEAIRGELDAISIEQVVYAWILALPSQPLPIIGSGKIDRVTHASQAADYTLSRQQWFRIRRAALGYDVP